MKNVGGYQCDRPAIEPDEINGVIGDPTEDVVYDREGRGWHLVSHEWQPPPGKAINDHDLWLNSRS